METFSSLQSLYEGTYPPAIGEVHSQSDTNVELWRFFVVCLNKLSSKKIELLVICDVMTWRRSR